MAWLTSVVAVGTAAGSAAAEQVIDVGGPLGIRLRRRLQLRRRLTCMAGLTWLTV